LAALLRTVPRPVGSGAAALIARMVAEISPERREVVARNLRRVVGPDVGDAELQRLVRRAFASYGRYWADAAGLDPSRTSALGAGVTLEGAEHVRAAHRAGKGAVVVLPHVGSWEIGAVWAAREGFPLTTVAEPLEPPELFAWFVAQREALGMRVLPLGAHATTELLSTLHKGGFVALLADRDIVGDGVEVELFGERTRLPGGPALLALRTGAPVIAAAVYMRPRGRHHLVVRPPLEVERQGHLRDDVVRVTQAVAHELEALVRLAPEQWHVFQPNWPSDECA
jgi:KDO2-lipid IV(A) lauroyltransferase